MSSRMRSWHGDIQLEIRLAPPLHTYTPSLAKEGPLHLDTGPNRVVLWPMRGRWRWGVHLFDLQGRSLGRFVPRRRPVVGVAKRALHEAGTVNHDVDVLVATVFRRRAQMSKGVSAISGRVDG